MPPKRKGRGGPRPASRSIASTPGTNEMTEADDENTTANSLKSPLNSSMTPSLASSRNRGTRKEPVNDEWTDEQDTSLFKGLIQWKPVGMHKHFRMIALAGYLRNHGYDPEIETHTRPDGIRAHLEKYFDLETLGQREDHIDEDSRNPAYIEFSLPEEEYEEMMWEQGRIKKTQKDGANATEAGDEDAASSPPSSNPSASPAPTIGKRKRADTAASRTRQSTVEDTDDAVSSVQSPARSAVPTTSRSTRTNKRGRAASGSRHASKDTTVDDDGSHIGTDDNGTVRGEETDDTASVKASTKSNTAKRGKGGAKAKGQTTARKRGRKK